MTATLIERARSWAKAIKKDVVALYLAGRDSRTPLAAKIVAIAVAAYALSPIDLIPDVIPVLGYLDDIVIVPLGILLAVRLIPPPLMAEFRAAAERMGRLAPSAAGATIIVLLWVMALALSAWWLWPMIAGPPS